MQTLGWSFQLECLLGNDLEIGAHVEGSGGGEGSKRGRKEKLSGDTSLRSVSAVPWGALELGWPISDAMS